RDLCIFAPHNIFRDPPFSRIDFISCCNLMIYLDTVLQKKIIATFHYALNNNGYLMLGKSETIGASGRLFVQVEKKYKIYSRKKDAQLNAILEMNYRVTGSDRLQPPGKRTLAVKETTHTPDLEKNVDNLLLSRYVPACVVVNQDLEILQFRGSTGLFLEPSPGKASLNLVKMAKPGLAFELRNAIHKSSRTGESIKKAGLEIKHHNQLHQVSIEVTPMKSDGEEKLFLVIFQELPSNIEAGVRPSLTKDKLVKQLQDELNAVKENMRSIIEAQEASNEELQSANEEIISSNEELQSINHELETSKEEVESTNEELMTINTELQMRNEQLAEAYDYAEAVFTTIREGVLVLTNDLRVKSANRAFYRIFQVNENAVEGTLVYNLGNGQWNIPKLRELLEEVIPHNFEFNGFEVTHVFPFIGKKTMLLNARRILQKIHRQQLILLTIEDITEHREAQARLTEEKRRIQNIVNNAPVMLWMADPGKKMTFVNNAWLEFTGHELGQEIGLGWQEGIHADDMAIWRRTFDDAVANKRAFEVEYRFRRHDGIYRHVRNTGKPVILEDGSFTGFTGSCVEIAGQV
ncbi:MAG TPA: PAS domain S-box protein, partial [Chitinophagaceae bacterium]|nr:PAS domain S-box protein [Chitinophagaceae bacterium]